MRPRLLVVAAHPDDETIGAAGPLLAASRAVVVHVTDGAPRDPALRGPLGGGMDRNAYARLRRGEAVSALAEAGVDERDVLALGFVDQEAAAALSDVARELAAIVRALRPGVVVTHAIEGGHPDHDASAIAVRAARALLLRAGAAAPPIVEMTSYHQGPSGLVTGAFLDGSDPGRARVLGPAERHAKRLMLSRYQSQREVLAGFDVEVERFRRAAPLLPGRRPHEGPLHYERMGWARFEDLDAAAREAASRLRIGEAPWP